MSVNTDFSLATSSVSGLVAVDASDRSVSRPVAKRKEVDRIEWKTFALIGLQLVGLGFLIYRFQIESEAFRQITYLAYLGFGVHFLIPSRYRPALFLCLCVAGIIWVTGVTQALWLFALGLGLIGIVHLPLPMTANVILLLIAGAVLAALRDGWSVAPWSAGIWPIIGSMFMFRLMVYVYDLSHGQGQASIWQRLSYFFMLPNVCFPLFPVVDFRTFVRTYQTSPTAEVYQTGVEWIFRGVVQLILYRLVNLFLAVDPDSLVNVGDVIHHFVWLFLLYLRVSGQFHIIVGMMRLFGFELPETHRRYFLASSFTDFWRRINIYWKDFMMKVFYYPMFFRLKRLGTTSATALSTIYVFLLTWALHAYQWFWIRGSALLTWNDALFWTILCLLVVVNAMWELKSGRRRTLSGASPSWKDRFVLAGKTVGTFSIICVLWSFWSSESIEAWTSLWVDALAPPTGVQLTIACAVIGLIGTTAVLYDGERRLSRNPIVWTLGGRVATTVVALCALNAMSISAVYNRLGDFGTVLATLRFGGMNQGDMDRLERGYYEELLTIDRVNAELGALYSKRPPEWEVSLIESGLARPAIGLPYELVPSATGMFKGTTVRVNQWGMHDQEYSMERPKDIVRIALLGASHTMGSGVEREMTFEAILEERINQSSRKGGIRCEILNFAVYGYNPIDQLRVFEKKVLGFKPDVLLFVGHPGDAKRVHRYVASSFAKGNDLGHEYLSQIRAQIFGDGDASPKRIRRQLEPLADQILSWVYERLVADCRQRGIRPVWVLLPMVPESAGSGDFRKDMERAANEGFSVIDLSVVYNGYDRHALWLAEWDAHPNALGHRLIANRLYEIICQQEALGELQHMP